MTIKAPHSFHIPVMGTGYTLESPIKTAHYGISSVIPITDHRLLENVREMHCKQNNLPYTPIGEWESDGRAKSIQGFLDLSHDLVYKKFEALKQSEFTAESEITKYFELLPADSELTVQYEKMLALSGDDKIVAQNKLRELIIPGDIDVNIMTKLDGVNFTKDKEVLPSEFNDAHAALRGFAQSKLNASVVLSAGLNPRLYGYMANFKDFFPDALGKLKKRIILKVSDYRSAMIQGRFLAKKGLWVSEFRIESGLNCGGHAFASEGFLLGPILKEFKENKEQLVEMLFQGYSDALKSEKNIELEEAPEIKYTVQGGIGDYDEHNFFLDYYGMESVGWGSPFMLVPEAITIDDYTLELLRAGGEDDFYLSNVSPLGVPFNSIKNNLADIEKQKRIDAGKPGAACLKKHLEFNTEYTEHPICNASTQYLGKKIKEVKESISTPEEIKVKIDALVEKACLCVGLGNSVLYKHKLTIPKGNHGVVVCPGPNLAYFDKLMSLKEMCNHIYGRTTDFINTKRPHVFAKELKIYVDYLKNKIEEGSNEYTKADIKYFKKFYSNLQNGVSYYKELFDTSNEALKNMKDKALSDLAIYEKELLLIVVPEIA